MTPASIVASLLEDNLEFYVAAVLTPESQRALLQAVPPRHTEVIAHHVTISYQPTPEDFQAKYASWIDQEIPIEVIAEAADEQVQAVLVRAPSENKFPHITISTAEGVPARYSNDLLAKGSTPIQPLQLRAIVRLEPLD